MTEDLLQKTQNIEKALQETQNMMQMVINNVPQHIFWKDTNSVFLGCNENFAKAVGLNSPKEIEGKTDYDLADKDKADHFREIDQKVLMERKPIYDMIELHKNSEGEEVWVNINKVPLYDAHGHIIGVLGTFEDITKRITLETKLQKNFDKYQSLIESTKTAYIIMDMRLRIIEANSIFTDLMGCKDPSEIIGAKPRAWICTKDVSKFDNAFSKIEETGIINDLEIMVINDNSRPIYLAVTASLIENGGKRIVCLVRDISHKKNAEEKRFIEDQRHKDKIKQNIRGIRDKLREIRLKV